MTERVSGTARIALQHTALLNAELDRYSRTRATDIWATWTGAASEEFVHSSDVHGIRIEIRTEPDGSGERCFH